MSSDMWYKQKSQSYCDGYVHIFISLAGGCCMYVCMYVCTVDEEAGGEVDFPGGYGTKAHVTPRSAEELQV